MRSDKPTIAQVAQSAQVSKTTVSRYLNGRFEFMSAETRKRIQTVIEELEYRPNNLARGLKSKRSGLIGVLVADISSPFSSILVKGIGDHCKQNGFQTIIVNTDNDPAKEREYIQALMDNRVEGLIVNVTGKHNDFLLELREQGVPIVLADRPLEHLDFDTVTSNNFQMTYDTVQHLHQEGFRRVAFFTQDVSEIQTRYTRYQAFLQACRDLYDIQGDDWVYVIEPADIESVVRELNTFLLNGVGPSAVFAVNGVTLLSVVQAITRLKLTMPTDIGLCGYDDWGWAAVIPPGITVISQPSYRVGIEASKRLIQQILSNRRFKPKLVELPSELVIRGSTVLHPKS